MIKSNFEIVKRSLPPNLQLYFCYKKIDESMDIKQQSFDLSYYNNDNTNINNSDEKQALTIIYLKNVEKDTIDIEVENYAIKLTKCKPIDLKLEKDGTWSVLFDKYIGNNIYVLNIFLFSF